LIYATGSAIIVILHLTRLCLCLKQYVRNSVAGSENCNQSASELVGDFRPPVTPHVSKPHDYVNHMFIRLLSVDQIRSLESNLKFANSGLVWTIRLGCGFFIINLDRVSLHFQKGICS
jgi:hypothetical protein